MKHRWYLLGITVFHSFSGFLSFSGQHRSELGRPGENETFVLREIRWKGFVPALVCSSVELSSICRFAVMRAVVVTQLCHFVVPVSLRSLIERLILKT